MIERFQKILHPWYGAEEVVELVLISMYVYSECGLRLCFADVEEYIHFRTPSGDLFCLVRDTEIKIAN